MASQNPSPTALQAHLKRLWIHGFLAGFGVVLVILLICLFIWGWPTTSQDEAEEAAKPAPSQAPATPAAAPAAVVKTPPPPSTEAKPSAALETELSAVLAKLAEANQKKDLQQLMNLYSPSFPDLQQKTQEISRSWAAYDYLNLSFKLTEIASPTPESASARVTWAAKTRQRQTREIKDTTKTYLVRFTRSSGQWRIQSLNKVEKAAHRDKSS